MNPDLILILILIIINFAIALICLIVHLVRKQDRIRGLCRFVFMIFFPVVGPVMLGLSCILEIIHRKFFPTELNEAELTFSQKRMKLLQNGDVGKSLNTVPLEEALLVAGSRQKREALIDVLKTDEYEQVLPEIREAVEDEDMEISHYSASIITEHLSKFKKRENQLRKQMEDSGQDTDLRNYVGFLRDNLHPEMFSGFELKTYTELMDAAANRLYRKDSGEPDDGTISMLVNLLERAGKRQEAFSWVNKARLRCVDSLSCVKLCLSYYYKRNMRAEFLTLLSDLRHYPVVLDNETLEWIRFYSSVEK